MNLPSADERAALTEFDTPTVRHCRIPLRGTSLRLSCGLVFACPPRGKQGRPWGDPGGLAPHVTIDAHPAIEASIRAQPGRINDGGIT